MYAALLLALWWLPGVVPAAEAPPAGAAWSIDPARSEVQFSVRKFWITHARGTFPRLHGSLRWIDTGTGTPQAQVDAVLEVAALEMDSQHDRNGLLGPGFFDAARFPTIEFRSDPVTRAELARGGRLAGMLTLHGERQPVTLTLLPSGCPDQPLGCAIRLRGAIQRSTFGLDGWRGLVSDKVELRLSILLEGSGSLRVAPAPARR